MPNDEEGPKEESEEELPETEAEKPTERERRRRYLKLAGFGLPESPYDTVKTILRAMSKHGGAGTPLTLQQIAETAALNMRVVSINNRFLLSTGIVTKSGNSFYLTERGAQLALALDYNDVEDAGRAWRSIAAENEFFKKILGALDIREGMEREDFALHIARTAGAPNEPAFVRGGDTVVDVLLEAGLVKESESGKLVVTPEYRTLGTAPSRKESVGGEQMVGEIAPPSTTEAKGRAIGTAIVVNINVSLGTETTSDDVNTIASRIKELKEKLQ